eukprot:3107450-Rhodomonas_salina.8
MQRHQAWVTWEELVDVAVDVKYALDPYLFLRQEVEPRETAPGLGQKHPEAVSELHQIVFHADKRRQHLKANSATSDTGAFSSLLHVQIVGFTFWFLDSAVSEGRSAMAW